MMWVVSVKKNSFSRAERSDLNLVFSPSLSQWNDEVSATILSQVAKSMSSSSRILIVDRVVRPALVASESTASKPDSILSNQPFPLLKNGGFSHVSFDGDHFGPLRFHRPSLLNLQLRIMIHLLLFDLYFVVFISISFF